MPRKPGYKNPNAGRKKIPVIFEIPERTIIFDQVLFWINLQATREEIAGSFHVSVSTLDRRIKETYGMNFEDLKKRVDGEAKISLRRYQFQQAEKNATMAIWLGKIWLGQSDKDEMREIASDVVKQAIRELQAERGISTPSRSLLENESSVLDQGQPGQQNQVQSELGTASIMAEQASMQDNTQSETARYNDVFVPLIP